MAQYAILQFDMNFRSLFHNPCVKSALFLPSRCFGACFVPFSRWVETNYTKDGCVSVIEHYRLWHHRVTGAYKIHKYIESCSTYRGLLCSSGLSDSAAMFVSPSIFFSPENDSRPPRSKAATYSESAIKILLASTFDKMCHKTGLEPRFHISLSNTLGGRARELIKTSHTAPTC